MQWKLSARTVFLQSGNRLRFCHDVLIKRITTKDYENDILATRDSPTGSFPQFPNNTASQRVSSLLSPTANSWNFRKFAGKKLYTC